jgi:hypothetical protein
MFKISIEHRSFLCHNQTMNNVHSDCKRRNQTGRELVMISGLVSFSWMSVEAFHVMPVTGWLNGASLLVNFATGAASFYIGLAIVLVALAIVATIVERFGLDKPLSDYSAPLRQTAAALNLPANDNSNPIRDLPGGKPVCSPAAPFLPLPQPRHLRRA